tara:strand:+ start:1071 stop:1499 length:429 start_codon:yes stop_codon:yes gene_type:complete
MTKIVRVGLAGYCPPSKFDEDEAGHMITDAFNYIESQFPDHFVYLVSGWTNVGIPALGYAEATKRGWSTVGVASNKAFDFELFPVNHAYAVGKNWGDESERFLSEIECMIRIGGGEQSMRETAIVRERGQLTLEYNLPQQTT